MQASAVFYVFFFGNRVGIKGVGYRSWRLGTLIAGVADKVLKGLGLVLLCQLSLCYI